MSIDAMPTIDLSALSRNDEVAVAALREASVRHGFFYLSGHGLTAAEMSAVLGHARALFALPEAAKRAIAGSGRPGARGHAYMGGRDSNGAAQGMLKEEYYLGRERSGEEANLWPAGLPGFQAAMMAYLDAMHDISARLMAGFALSLDLPKDHFVPFCTDPVAALRLVHYSAQALGAGPHSDFGSLTVLLQDDIGGLQVLSRDSGAWIDIPPVPGTFVVNVGDLFERWTNDRYRSSVHRVINLAGQDRYSVPFFLTGAAAQDITCLPSCLLEGEAPHYPPTTVAEHLRAGFAAQGF